MTVAMGIDVIAAVDMAAQAVRTAASLLESNRSKTFLDQCFTCENRMNGDFILERRSVAANMEKKDMNPYELGIRQALAQSE